MVVCCLLVGLAACGDGEEPEGTGERTTPPPEDFGILLVLQPEDPAKAEACAQVLDRRLVAEHGSAEARGDGTVHVLLDRDATSEHVEWVKGLCLRKGGLEFTPVAKAEVERAERARRKAKGGAYAGPPEGFRWMPGRSGGPDRLLEVVETTWTSADLDPAELKVQPDNQGFGFTVAFGIAESRREEFEGFSASFLKRQLAIVLDGEVESAPVIRDRLPGKGIISGGGAGGFSREEARELLSVLKSGVLPCRLELVAEKRPGDR